MKLRLKIKPKLTGTFYNVWQHASWGNRLEIDSHYNANGHLPFYLEVGDGSKGMIQHIKKEHERYYVPRKNKRQEEGKK